MLEGRGVGKIFGSLGMITALLAPSFAVAETDVTQLQQTITEKKAEISALNTQLESYRSKIRELANQGATLQNDIALLENEIAMSQLDIAATQNEIDQETLELRILDQQIDDTTEELSQRKAMLADILFAMNKTDEHGVLDVVFNIGSVNDIFDAAQQLTSVNETMKSSLEATQLSQQELESRHTEHEQKTADLVAIEKNLQEKTENLSMRKNAKEVLVSATQDSENQYRTLMSEIRSEQQDIVNQVADLQDEVQTKLSGSDEALSGETRFTWPIHGAIVTTLFHDPNYPFTNIVGPHSGMDLAIAQGTAIESAAPGYVARVYRGQDYGYYVMIIHANGFATLYAHMSRIDVELDQYVARGQVIGLTGGRPGTPGAGFSTGPHLHFEVRLNGIPVNPLAYLDLANL